MTSSIWRQWLLTEPRSWHGANAEKGPEARLSAACQLPGPEVWWARPASASCGRLPRERLLSSAGRFSPFAASASAFAGREPVRDASASCAADGERLRAMSPFRAAVPEPDRPGRPAFWSHESRTNLQGARARAVCVVGWIRMQVHARREREMFPAGQTHSRLSYLRFSS